MCIVRFRVNQQSHLTPNDIIIIIILARLQLSNNNTVTLKHLPLFRVMIRLSQLDLRMEPIWDQINQQL